jgi:hypothetical protein
MKRQREKEISTIEDPFDEEFFRLERSIYKILSSITNSSLFHLTKVHLKLITCPARTAPLSSPSPLSTLSTLTPSTFHFLLPSHTLSIQPLHLVFLSLFEERRCL